MVAKKSFQGNRAVFFSNFEKIVQAISVFQSGSPSSAVLNKEEEAHSDNVVGKISEAFQEVSVHGLKVLLTEDGKQNRVTYLPTLSAFKFCRAGLPVPLTFSQQGLPPYNRNLFTKDLENNLSEKQSSCLKQGWFAVLYTQQRSAHSSQEISFLAYYSVSQSHEIKLLGLLPSRNLFADEQRAFWFDC